jgi:SAM-dependent methyltransferase
MSGEDTRAGEYAERLVRAQRVWWKRVLPVQAPYRWNLRRQHLGVTLDVGCGIGRNLATLPPGSLGVDHNADAVAHARAQGLDALTVAQFRGGARARPRSFDALLLAHVVEHMDRDGAVHLLREYLPFVRPGGTVFFICPQERGFASDPTHVWFATGDELASLSREVGLEVTDAFSFPFPRCFGRTFVYNEFCVRAKLP